MEEKQLDILTIYRLDDVKIERTHIGGCPTCNYDEVRQNKYVTLLVTVTENDVELYRCTSCGAYFEYKDDKIHYMDENMVMKVYNIKPPRAKLSISSLGWILFVCIWCTLVIGMSIYTGDWVWLFSMFIPIGPILYKK